MLSISTWPRSVSPKALSARLVPASTALAIVVSGVIVAVVGAWVGALVLFAVGIAIALYYSPRDLVSFCVAGTLLFMLWPGTVRLAPAGAMGTMPILFSTAAALVWATLRLRRSPRLNRQGHPLTWACALLAVSSSASYVSAQFRSLDTLEASAADRGLLVITGSAAMALLVADGAPSTTRLYSLIRGIAAAATLVATIGILQFLFQLDITNFFAFPLMEEVASDWSPERSGFLRIQSTAAHPIELSAVLGSTMPLLLHLALKKDEGRRWFWWYGVLAIAVSIPMTVSRSAIVALAVGALVVSFAFGWRARINMAIAAIPMAYLMRSAFPGLLGTVLSLFKTETTQNDPSIRARAEDLLW